VLLAPMCLFFAMLMNLVLSALWDALEPFLVAQVRLL
jgi:hypothetical protein